jgi:hypothetical protein
MASLTTGDTLGILAFLFSSAGLVYAAINHKRIRCKFCGKDIDISVDVDSTEPTVKLPSDNTPSTNKVTPPPSSIPVKKNKTSKVAPPPPPPDIEIEE